MLAYDEASSDQKTIEKGKNWKKRTNMSISRLH